MTRLRLLTRTLAGLAGLALVAGACSSDERADLVDQLEGLAEQAGEEAEEAEEARQDAERDTASEREDEGGGLVDDVDLSGLVAQVPEGTVYHQGFEFTVTAMELVDIDAELAEETGMELTHRIRGFELVAEVEVFNTGGRAGAPRSGISLRWDEPGSDNVVNLRGRLEVREIPSLAQSSGELVVPISPDDAELLDVDSAALVVGEEGRSPAVLPIGSGPDLVTRFPVAQPELAGTALDVGDTLVTITDAWIYPGTVAEGHFPDGEVLLELTYDLEQRSDMQTCSARSTGSWSLSLPSGSGVVDLGVSERCVRGDTPVRDVRTGFRIDADYAGEYTLVHERGGAGQDFTGEITFTLTERDGVPHRDLD